MDSIFERDRKDRCFLCGYNATIEKHHIFGGSNRKKSEKYGLTVHLCHWCHNEPPNGVHHNKERRLLLQQTAQMQWQETFGKTEADFIQEFGRSYLYD